MAGTPPRTNAESLLMVTSKDLTANYSRQTKWSKHNHLQKYPNHFFAFSLLVRNCISDSLPA
ncbi:MAG: hypothetical protein VYB66_04165, partial [Verrucomicrobiota bacterium]|nr:hypothetical protein [Verrucomicrobiota bacterium]